MRNEKGQFIKGIIPWIKGKTHSQAVRAKLRLSHLGKKLTPEQIAKIVAKTTGKKRTPETRLRMSLAQKGRKFTPEHVAKIMAGRNKPEAKAKYKLSASKPRPHMRGKNNPNWKDGGITRTIDKKLRMIAPYQDWRKSVYQKDDYTCQLCGDKGKKLNADHFPIPFSNIVNRIRKQYGDDEIYNMIIKDAVFLDINNGRTLCESCHIQTDTYGSRAKNYQLTN